MTIKRAGGLAAAGLLWALVSAPFAAAQGGGPPAGRAGVQRGNAARDGEAMRLQQERRLQERIDQVVRDRLALTEDQFTKIKEVASRIEDDRRVLRNEEMTVRFAMRQELLAGTKADENLVADFLVKLPRFERRRIELMEQEQKELSRFLTPTQRARYIGLQEELRRSMQDLQRRRMEGAGASAGSPATTRRPPMRP